MSDKAKHREALELRIALDANPPHKYGHQPRLYALTRVIGEGLDYDDDIVHAAVWMHDLGVFIGHRPESEEMLKKWDHVVYAIHVLPAILKSAGFPVEKIPAVLEVIKTHQPQDDPQTLEAIIVRDADILEQLGAIGIVRTTAKLGSDTRFITFSDLAQSLRRQLDVLPAKLRLASSQQLVQPKVQMMHDFIRALEIEGGAELN
jgi:uncharacterized protein